MCGEHAEEVALPFVDDEAGLGEPCGERHRRGPAGAGAVEPGFLAGAAGDPGTGEAELLVGWRLDTTVLGSALGVVAVIWRFHVGVMAFVRRRSGRPPTDVDPD